MSSEKEISVLKTKRASVIGRLTKLRTFFLSAHDEISSPELETRLGMLESLAEKFDDYQTNLEVLDERELEGDKRNEFDKGYCEVKTKILTSIGAKKPRVLPQAHDESFVTPVLRTKNAHLPKIQLTKFSGQYTEWPNFYSMFLTLVDSDEDLSSIEKFQHLRSCLTDSALRTIESLEISSENYIKAMKLLKARFNNNRLIFQAHIKELFNLHAVTSPSAIKLRELSDSVNSHLRALQSLGNKEQIADNLLIFLIGNKLDVRTQSKWEEDASHNLIPSWDEMSSFLGKRCQMLENLEGTLQNTSNKRGNINNFQQKTNSRKVLITSNNISNSINPCLFCNSSGHNIFSCQSFIKLPIDRRISESKGLCLCLNCLRKGHLTRFCRSKGCKQCKGRHHSLLHLGSSADNSSDILNNKSAHSSPPVYNQTSSQPDPTNTALTSTLNDTSTSISNKIKIPSNRFVFLATAIVLVQDKYGKFIPGRALLDSASQLHFVTSRFAQLLAVKRIAANLPISGINSTFASVKQKINITLQSRVNEYTTTFDCFVLPSITENQPNRNFDCHSFCLPKNIELADPLFYEAKQVDMLIGASLFYELLSIGQIRLGDNMPILQKTRLGWIVSGNYDSSNSTDTCLHITSKTHNDNIEDSDSLNQLLKCFWEMESCETPSQTKSPEELDCENSFVNTHIRLPSGQYAVKLPFKISPTKLGLSYESAKKRFFNLESKLNRNPQIKQQYIDFMSEYKQLNHMSLASPNIIQETHFFLPHHCVLKANSSTTKLRVVFDGSAKTSNGISLNDILMVGPTIQADLFSILLRFRMHRLALTADIAKMYRCVQMQPPDDNLHCILWRDNISEDIKIFKLKTVTYGTAPASFLAIRSLHQLALDEEQNFPIGSKVARSDFYVDDLLTGADTIYDLIEIRNQIYSLLHKGGFHLRKWCSNSKEILSDIALEEREDFLHINNGKVTKTLGLFWNPQFDEFCFSHRHSHPAGKITKRIVLSEIARLYDPLGFIGPVILQAKIFIQTLWKQKLNWDETLPVHLHTQWKQFCDELPLIDSIKLARYVLLPKATLQLHGFADASMDAFGACIYIKSIEQNGKVQVRLLCSKSRVAPISTISIPRMELSAALLLTELIDRVLKTIPLIFKSVTCWSDFTIVLAWISSPACTWNTFVANRVTKIQNLSKNFEWRHICTNHNPADILSRGMSPLSLSRSDLWFNGPTFLKDDSVSWPTLDTYSIYDIPERRTSKTCLLSSKIPDIALHCKFINDFNRIRRTFAFIHRFIKNTSLPKGGRVRTPLSASDLDFGLQLLIRSIQRTSFPDEYKRLQGAMEIRKDSCLKTLNPFLDDFGLIRIGGRLKNSLLNYDAKHQIILPKYHRFTQTIINHFHIVNLHAGCQALTHYLRARFWPLGGRHTIRRVINKCLRCFKARPIMCRQLMGDLPSHRIQPSKPFHNCGIDFCGPFYIKSGVRGKGPIKTYVCVFICMATKAVHLELATDLSTSAFLSTFRRFTSRRGKPHTIFSDNATNFVGANSQLQELKEIFDKEQRNFELIHKECVNEGIDWKFIPARSPHFGGLWEASVKIAKHHLRRVVGYTILSFDDLHTLICQIEAIINSRPLSPLSDDPDDLSALTPGHFLVGTSITAIPEPDFTAQKIGRLASWQQRQSIQQHFWNRWSKEYLNTLQERHKWYFSSKNIVVGTLVLIKDDNLPSMKWPLARVVETYTGADGRVRVVKLKTQDGLVKRALSKICILPINNPEENTN